MQSFATLIAVLEQRQHRHDQLAHTQRLDALGQLAGGIAHDLNSLLALMSGNLQLLQTEYPKAPRARRLIGSVLHSVGDGTALTGKLVSLARRQRLTLQPLDLKTALHAVEQMLGRTLGGNVRVHLAVCG